jgi:hypothetical protein
VGDLATDFTVQQIEDSNFVRRIWAGSSTGHLQQLSDGNSDAGAEFTAKWTALLNFGPDNPQAEALEFFGDSTAELWYAKYLSDSEGNLQSIPLHAVIKNPDPDGPSDKNSQYIGNIKDGELKFAYVEIRLTSHSADIDDDADELNTPAHFPLENYGTIYSTRGLMAGAREAE